MEPVYITAAAVILSSFVFCLVPLPGSWWRRILAVVAALGISGLAVWLWWWQDSPAARTFPGVFGWTLLILTLLLCATSLPCWRRGSARGDESPLERHAAYRFATYAVSAYLLALLFSALPMKARSAQPDQNDYLLAWRTRAAARFRPPAVQTPPAPKAAGAPADTGAKLDPDLDFLKEEHKKVVEEIKMRIQQGDDWFHRKFIMIGGLVAAVLAALGSDALTKASGKARESSGDGDQPDAPPATNAPQRPSGSAAIDQRFGTIMRSNAACSLLALAVAVAVSIDIQTKISDSVVQQLALWVNHIVEPAFFGDSTPSSPGHTADANSPGLLGFETALRLPGSGMHTDPLSKLLLHPHGYFLTWAVYLLYLTSFHKVCFRAANEPRGHFAPLSQQRIALAGFGLVHFYLAAFTVITHSAPSGFELSIGGTDFSGDKCGWLFLIPWALLVAVHRPYWSTLVAGSFKSEQCERPIPQLDHTGSVLRVTPEKERRFTQGDTMWVLVQQRPNTDEPWTSLPLVLKPPDGPVLPPLNEPAGQIFRAAYLTEDGERGNWSSECSVLTSPLVNTKWVGSDHETLKLLPESKAEWSTPKQLQMGSWKVTNVALRTIELNMEPNNFTITFADDWKTGVLGWKGLERDTKLIRG